MTFRNRDREKVILWLAKNSDLWENDFSYNGFMSYNSKKKVIAMLKNLDFYSDKTSNQDIRIDPLAKKAYLILTKESKHE